jgi:hypothetical protein
MSKFNVNQTGQQVVLGRQKKDIRWIMLSKLWTTGFSSVKEWLHLYTATTESLKLKQHFPQSNANDIVLFGHWIAQSRNLQKIQLSASG